MRALRASKTAVAALAIVVSIVAITSIIFSKGYKRFVYRLMLYLLVIDNFCAVTNILEGVPLEVEKNSSCVRLKEGWNSKEACRTIGFLNQVAEWMQNFVILWIITYLLMLVIKLLRPHIWGNSETRPQRFAVAEYMLLVLCIVVPFGFKWIPFIKEMYGVSGLWCWIKVTKTEQDKETNAHGVALIFTLFYGPLLLIVVYVFIAVLIIIAVLLHRVRRRRGIMWQQQILYKKGIKEAMPLLIYPLIFSIICTFLLANRIYYAVHEEKNTNIFLWYAQAISDPCRKLIPPLAFMLHPSTWKNLLCKKQQEDFVYTSAHLSAHSDMSDSIRIRDRDTSKVAQYQSIFTSKPMHT